MAHIWAGLGAAGQGQVLASMLGSGGSSNQMPGMSAPNLAAAGAQVNPTTTPNVNTTAMNTSSNQVNPQFHQIFNQPQQPQDNSEWEKMRRMYQSGQ
jgi:hypothetical protein